MNCKQSDTSRSIVDIQMAFHGENRSDISMMTLLFEGMAHLKEMDQPSQLTIQEIERSMMLNTIQFFLWILATQICKSVSVGNARPFESLTNIRLKTIQIFWVEFFIVFHCNPKALAKALRRSKGRCAQYFSNIFMYLMTETKIVRISKLVEKYCSRN